MKVSGKDNSWRGAVARGIGVGGLIDFTPTRVGQTLHIPCSRGHVVDFPLNVRMPPEAVAKKMMHAGWSVGSKLLCPEHAGTQRKPKPAQAPENEEPMATEATKPTPAAGRAKRLVYMALEDHYDENAKRYRGQHSDASIAKALGVAEEVVKRIREESYGPLGEPFDVSEFRTALAEYKKDIGNNAEELLRGVMALEKRLDDMIRKNGWKE